MNKDLIDFYEAEKLKLEREISDLWEVGKKSSRRKNRLIEIEYILNGLYANKENARLRQENKDLKLRLEKEGIDIDNDC
jgi:hypothetical protein